MPSNSRKILRPSVSAGSLKCLRYQAMPVERSLMSFLNASSSFQAYGVVTFFQPESSKPTVSAPLGSPTKTLQCELKLYFARALATGTLATAAVDADSNATHVRTISRLAAAIKKIFASSDQFSFTPRFSEVCGLFAHS